MNTILAWLLSALPFPAPQAITPDPTLKFTTGTIAAIHPESHRLVIRTQSGPQAVDITTAKLIGPAQAPIAESDLRENEEVNVYFVITEDAIAREVDVIR
jgi:hypothetical protein